MAKERMLAESNVIDDECEEGEIRDDSCFEDLSSDETFSLDTGNKTCVEYQGRPKYSNRTSTLPCDPESLTLKTKKISSDVEMIQEKENRVTTASDLPSKIVLHAKFRKRSRSDAFQNSPRKHYSLSDKSKRRHHNMAEGSNCDVLRRDISQVSKRTRVKKKHDIVSRHKMKAAHGKDAKYKKHHKKSNFDGIGEVCRKRMKRSHKQPGVLGQHTVSANTSLRRRLQNMGVTLPTLNLSTTSEPSVSSPPPPSAPSPPPPSSPLDLHQSPQPNTFSTELVLANNNHTDVDNEIIILPIPEKPPVEVIDILSSPEVVRDCKSPDDLLTDNEELLDQVVVEKNKEISVAKVPENITITENAVKEADTNVCVEDDEVLQLRLIALRSAILKKHQNRKKRGVSGRQNRIAPGGNSPDLHHVSPVTATEKVENNEPDEITTLVDMELADTDEEREPSEENGINVNVPQVVSNTNTELPWDQSCTPAYSLPTSYVGYESCGIVPYCAQPVGTDFYKNIHIAPVGHELSGPVGTENLGESIFLQSPSTSSCSLSSHCVAVSKTCQPPSLIEDHSVNQVICRQKPEDETDDDPASIDLASMIVLDEVGPEDDGQGNDNSLQDEQDEDEDVLRAKLLHTMTKSKQKQNIPDSTSLILSPPYASVNHTLHSVAVNGEHSQIDGTSAEINYATMYENDVCCPGEASPHANVLDIPIIMTGPKVETSIPSVQRSFRRVRHRAVQARQIDRKVYPKKQLARALRYTRKKVNLSVPNSAQSLKVMIPVKVTPCPSERFVICLKDDESDSEDEVSVPRIVSGTSPGPEERASETPPELEERISMFLKEARMSQEAAQESGPVTQKTPAAVQHLPPSQRDEYRRLKDQVVKLEEMNRLRRLQLASASTKSLSPVRPVTRRLEPADTLLPASGVGEKVAWQAGGERLVTATNKLMVTISQPKQGGVGPASSITQSTSVTKPQTLDIKSSKIMLKNIAVGNLNARKNLLRKITNRETSLVKTQHRLPLVQNSSHSASFSAQKLITSANISSLPSKLDGTAKQVKNNTNMISFGNNLKQMISGSSSTTPSQSKVLGNQHVNTQRQITLSNASVATNGQTNNIKPITHLAESMRPNIFAEKRIMESVPMQQSQSANVHVVEKIPCGDTQPGQVLTDRKQFTSGTGSEMGLCANVRNTTENVKGLTRDSSLTAISGNNSQLGCVGQKTITSVKQTAVEKLAVVSNAKHDLLHDLEQKLHEQRCCVLEDMTNTWDLLHRIEQSQEEEDTFVAEVGRLKAELRLAEQRLEAKRRDVTDMRSQVVQAYGRVMKGKDSCKELGKSCQAVGTALHGKLYRVPNAREELMVSKLHQIANYTRKLSKKRMLNSALSRSQGSAEKLHSDSAPEHDANCLDRCGVAPGSQLEVATGESVPSELCSMQSGPGDPSLVPAANSDNNPGSEVGVDTPKMSDVVHESSCTSKASDVIGTLEMSKEIVAAKPLPLYPVTVSNDSAGTAKLAEELPATDGAPLQVAEEETAGVLLTREHRGPVLGLEEDIAGMKHRTHCGWMQPATHFWPSCSKWAGKIDPGRPLCPYELRGSCRDQECLYQHVWGAHS